MNWTGKRVLVTGAGGFIGSHLTERLVALGASARALIHYNSAGSAGWLDSSAFKDEIELVMGDIRDPDSIERAVKNIDIIFHLAALIAIPYSYQAPLSYIRTNVEGTLNILQAALSAEVGLVVHTSTSEVYGSAVRIPIDEEHPLKGQSPYAASKIGADKIAEAFNLSFGLPIVIVRPFNTYGPRQSARAIVPTIVVQALRHDVIRLGNLHPRRDLNFVADTVEGFIKAAETPAAMGTVFNLGSGNDISIGDLVALILKLMEKDLPVICDPGRLRPSSSEVDHLRADSRKANEVLGWRHQFRLEQGLIKTIDWIKENQNRFKPEINLL